MAVDPRDIEIRRLRKRVAELEETIAERDAVIAARDQQIEKLSKDFASLAAMVKQLTRGTHLKLPVVDENQQLLFPDGLPSGITAEDESDDDDEEDDRPKPPNSGRQKSQRNRGKVDTTGMQRVTKVHELPEAERVCPVTGLALVPIGMKIEEELEHQPAKLFVTEHHRTIYGPAPDDAAERQIERVIAPGPALPLGGCIASASVLAWLLVQKYGHHLPLYRQETIFERAGLHLSRKTLCGWVLAAAEKLAPIVDFMLSRVREGPVLQIDDTPVRCQAGRGEPNFEARFWTFINPDYKGVVFRFTAGRTADELSRQLVDFDGVLFGDGYAGNAAAARLVVERRRARGENDVTSVVIGCCWAHVTRKFRDAESEAKAAARLFRDDIRELYAIEKRANRVELAGASERPAARLALRRSESRPVVRRILRRLRRMKPDFDEAGLMGEALTYLWNQAYGLTRFLWNAQIPLDNNACERSIRPIAVGRRNWLFAGSMNGGRAAAVVYSLIESCKVAGIDPQDYLTDALQRVGGSSEDEIRDLIPALWSPARPVGSVATELIGAGC